MLGFRFLTFDAPAFLHPISTTRARRADSPFPGPDASRMYDADGYEYLAENFPKLDYIDRCYVVDEEAVVLSVEL